MDEWWRAWGLEKYAHVKGYILEADLEYDKELNDLHNDYPLTAENVIPPGSKVTVTITEKPQLELHWCYPHVHTSSAGYVGSGLRRHFPLLPFLGDGLVTCRRVDLVTCPRAALARLPRRLWTRWTIAGQCYVSLSLTLHERIVRRVGRMQLLVDNGWVYEAHGNELELHNYRQLEAEWQIGHRRRRSGHYNDRLGFERRRRSPKRRRRVRKPKRPVQNGTVRDDLAILSDGTVRNDEATGSAHNLSVNTAAEPLQ